MDDHVAPDLTPIQTIIPYLERRYQFKTDNVENKDIQCVITTIYKELFNFSFMAVEPRGDVMHHQEADNAGEG